MTNICLEFEALHISSPDPALRLETIHLTKRWIDHAVELGCARVMVVTSRERSRPQANLSSPQSRVRPFKNDAAYIFVGEEIVARELEVILRAFCVAEERVAPPAGKEADIVCRCNSRLTPRLVAGLAGCGKNRFDRQVDFV
jgi:hypothetical protein